MTALLAAVSMGCTVYAFRRRRIDPGTYLTEATPDVDPPRPRRIEPAGLLGAATGLMVAATVRTDAAIPLTLLGLGAGFVVERAIASTRRTRAADRLLYELPTITDTIALHVLAGDSVQSAIDRVVEECVGTAAGELATASEHLDGIEGGLRRATASTVHPQAARLYDLLAHSHRTGGRLADALSELATDYRATIAHELSAESGRRALTSYGPILLFMIPVTLVFLMYPTLSTFSSLSSSP